MINRTCLVNGVMSLIALSFFAHVLLYSWTRQFDMYSAKDASTHPKKMFSRTEKKSVTGVHNMKPVITLFTTVKDLSYRKDIHLNTIRNWASLIPLVQPVLFVANLSAEYQNATSWGNIAYKHGWDILQYGPTLDGVPILKHMFIDIMNSTSDSIYVGYSNADILFDQNMVHTLTAFDKYLGGVRNKMVFISGRRKNMLIGDLLNGYTKPFHPETVYKAAQNFNLNFFRQDSADYFIFSKAGFYWKRTPNFIVGRSGYDSWFLGQAVRWKVPNLDASLTILAMHQTGSDGNHAGETINKDLKINRKMMSKSKFNYKSCQHYCAIYSSKLVAGCYWNSSQSCIQIEKREKRSRPRGCLK